MQPPEARAPAVRTVKVRRRGERLDEDLVVVEEPLEIRLAGKPLVVTMRTPGYDEELAAGFLYGEGTITGGGDIASVRAVAGAAARAAGGTLAGGTAPAGSAAPAGDGLPAGSATPSGDGLPAGGGTRAGGAAPARDGTAAGDRPSAGDGPPAGGGARAGGVVPAGDGAGADGVAPGRTGLSRIRVTRFAGDRVDVTLTDRATTPGAPGSSAGPLGAPSGGAAGERAFAATSACGVCGKESIDDLRAEAPPVAPVECAPALLEALPDRLRAAQTLFDATGGIHAAGIFSLDGELLCVREDIGRHNAVDKVIGHFVLQGGVPLRARILVVSGRAGFELVQKALAASIPAMVSVGAASSVAVDMATAAGMTLYSFAGRGRGNLHVA